MNRLAVVIAGCTLLLPSGSADAQQESTLRFGLMGLPPGPSGVKPAAESQAHAQWIVSFDADAKPVSWQRIAPNGDPTTASDTSIAHTLLIDAEPPTAALSFSGEVVEPTNGVTVSPRALLAIESDDPSGVARADLWVNDQPATNPKQWAEQRADGTYTLSLMVKDALGNEGQRAALNVRLDRTPPAHTWQRLDARDGVAADIFDGKRVRLAIRVNDSGAGAQALQLGKMRYDASQLSEGPITVKLDAQSLDYTLTDRVGNVGTGSIALRADSEGPSLTAIRNGQAIALDGASLQRSDSLTLRADDALSGVARACVEASIWYGQCAELPVELVGIAPGLYALEFRAADRLGNKTYTRLRMEVLP